MYRSQSVYSEMIACEMVDIWGREVERDERKVMGSEDVGSLRPPPPRSSEVTVARVVGCKTSVRYIAVMAMRCGG